MTPTTLLHSHSTHSPLWGVHPPGDLVRRAHALGYKRISLTDRNGLYGLFLFLDAAKLHGATPIPGAEVECAGERAVLWVRDSQGYKNLCRILSARHCDPAFSVARALAAHRGGLIVASDCEPLLTSLAAVSPRDLYVELSPGHEMHAALKFARARGLPPVATTRAVGFDSGDLALHRVLRAVALSTKLSRLPEAECARQWDIVLSPSDLADRFPHCPDAVENAEEIADRCGFAGPDTSTVLPVFRGLSPEKALALLRSKAYDGAARRYGGITPAVEARLEKELGMIGEKGFASYFLVVEDIVARSPRTCGRGSAAASLIAYSLGITHVDPIKHNLFFERFLNPGRIDPPDIDVDFPWDERDGLIDAVFALYGSRRVAMVANQVGFKPRAALREVAKVYGMPDAEISRMQKTMSGARRLRDATLARGASLSPPWPEILETAARLSGHLRHLSVHCGGLVIAPEDVRDHAVVQIAAKGIPVIQWEKEQCEDSGLVKIDLLGNRSLAVIRDVLDQLARKGSGRAAGNAGCPDFSTWNPADDPATQETVRRGETMGCFYVESPATRQLLRKMWHGRACRDRDVYEHLVMASSIIRPAANRFIRQFVARMRGEKWRPAHPLLANVLDETYGIAIYQEQVTQMAMALAGFTAAEGDWLRKILSKKDPSRTLADLADRFMRGARKRGVPPEAVEEAWEQILSFSGYSFCKPHSASYALVSLKCAYLKTHHPALFMAAVLANHGGYYNPFAYVSEIRRMGLKVLGPSVNAGGGEWSATADGWGVRVGLSEIKGITAEGLLRLLAEREKRGNFRDVRDFLHRTGISGDDARQLARAGALDELAPEGNRAAVLWKVDAEVSARKAERGAGLFGPEDDGSDGGFSPVPHDAATLRRMEWEALGFPLTFHPLSPYAPLIRRLKAQPGPPLIAGRELEKYAGRRVRMVGWRVTAKPVRTKDGEAMEFVSFEDTTALYETVLFPESYKKVWSKLSSTRPFLLEGRVGLEFGVGSLEVEKAEGL